MKIHSVHPSATPWPRVRTAAIAVLLSGALITLAGCTSSPAPVPQPTSTSPAAVLTEVDVPGTTAMSAAAIDLSRYGYTEREYYAQGEARRYQGAIAGSLEAAKPLEGTTPYTTRVLVRMPDPDEFNGTLVVEWTNVTLGQDADFVFSEAYNSILRDGYAYAVVSVQGVGVERLKTWNPERYSNLTVSGDNIDPDNGDKLDPCFMGAPDCIGDPLSWDVMTQVTQALVANEGADAPLAELNIDNVIATGQSQSAARLTTYYNTIQPLANVFDGFVFWDRAGELRSDLDVPGISVNSESLALPQPDAPSSELTRVWDVAGGSHGSLYAAQYMDTMMVRDESNPSPSGPLTFTAIVEPTCEALPAFSTIPAGLVVAAALSSVQKWITTGEAAPPSLYFERDDTGALKRNAEGAVEGGVRLAEFVAPTSDTRANNGPAFPCGISGYHRFLTDAELLERYPSHDAYVAEVTAATEKVSNAGYLLPEDAEATIAAAEDSPVAR